MDGQRILEVVVQGMAGEKPDETAQYWVHQLCLHDGVGVRVKPSGLAARPRQFMVYAGRAASPQAYAAMSMIDVVEKALRETGRGMDVGEIWSVVKRHDVPGIAITVTTVAQAARLLVQQGRAVAGTRRGIWMAMPRSEGTATDVGAASVAAALVEGVTEGYDIATVDARV